MGLWTCRPACGYSRSCWSTALANLSVTGYSAYPQHTHHCTDDGRHKLLSAACKSASWQLVMQHIPYVPYALHHKRTPLLSHHSCTLSMRTCTVPHRLASTLLGESRGKLRPLLQRHLLEVMLSGEQHMGGAPSGGAGGRRGAGRDLPRLLLQVRADMYGMVQ